MKSFVSRFMVASLVILLALSGVESGKSALCQKDRQSEEMAITSNNGSAERSDKPVVPREKKSQEPKRGFTFPNVFDAFRSIF